MKDDKKMLENPTKKLDSTTSGSPRNPYEAPLEESVSFHFYCITAMWTRITNRVYRERFGVTVPELRVLRILARSPGATSADICQVWSMDKGLCSRTVTALVKRGLVVKMPKVDKRSIRLKLSAAGEKAIDRMEPIRMARHSQFQAILEPDEYETLFRIFAKIETMLAESRLLNGGSGSDHNESRVAAYLDNLGVGEFAEGDHSGSGAD